MKIVIDIPEEVFDEIYNKNYYSLKGKEALRVAVRNGIPLPKGHGRLIDANTLRKKVSSWGLDDYTPEDFIDEIDNALTIIEADGKAE